MSSVTVYRVTCDRCGAEVICGEADRKANFEPILPEGWQQTRVRLNPTGRYFNHLCPVCYLRLEAALSTREYEDRMQEAREASRAE